MPVLVFIKFDVHLQLGLYFSLLGWRYLNQNWVRALFHLSIDVRHAIGQDGKKIAVYILDICLFWFHWQFADYSKIKIEKPQAEPQPNRTERRKFKVLKKNAPRNEVSETA